MSFNISSPLEARPVHFDREGRRLAGWYHPACSPEGVNRDCLVVMSNPLGYDAICTHRHYRQLALRLALDGFAVLRYDHHGTGDSSGSDAQPERVQNWLRGVGEAVAFGRQLSGASHASLFGIRMGGTLALAAAATEPGASGVGSVVAWAPFSSGNLYLREARAMRMLRKNDGSSETLAGAPVEAIGEESGGYLMTHESIAAMGTLDLTAMVTAERLGGRPVLLMSRDDIPHNPKLEKHLRKIGCEVSTTDVPGYAAMMRDTFDALVPDAALAEIVEWLKARHAPSDQVAAPVATVADSFLVDADGGRTTVRETVVRFGPYHNLFGILTAPVGAQPQRASTAVVFINTGSNHHIGPNRMYVTHARLLASRGFMAMRLDIGGMGESPASPGRRDNQLFGSHSIGEVHAAIAWLKKLGVSKVMLAGVCSGAYLSFRSALAEPAVTGVMLINPPSFNWRDGDRLDVRPRKDIRSLRFYRSRLLDAATWKRVVRGQVNLGWIARGVGKVVRERLARRLKSAVQRTPDRPLAEMQHSTDIKALFGGLLQRGVRVFMLYSDNDSGLDEVETHLGANAVDMRRQKHFRFEVLQGADHTLSPLWAQQKLGELLVEQAAHL